MKKLINRLIRKAVIRIGLRLQDYNGEISKASLPKFGNTPRHLIVELPRRIINSERIFIGDNVSIGPGSLLMAMTYYPPPIMRNSDNNDSVQKFESKIIIGDRVTSTANLQISAQSDIVIEDDVMFASNIHINDGFHGYDSAQIPYKYQNISNIDPIRIQRGCWIGQNVMVLPGVTIGELTIIGANSIVRENIPAKSIAVGNPARVIKQWDDDAQSWLRT